MGVRLGCFIGFAWSLAEATFFFIVPDVFLSYLAIGKSRPFPLSAMAFALAGALAGGAVMYVWASHDPVNSRAFVEQLPGIDAEMIAAAGNDFSNRGLLGLVAGGFTGVPYKVFAVEAAQLSMPLSVFLAMSVPARLLRWCLVVFIAHKVCKAIVHRWSLKAARTALLAFWAIFYVAFFSVMPA